MSTDAINGPRNKNRKNRPSNNTPDSRALWARDLLRQKWRNILLREALGRFDWKGLPDTVDERYLELTLLLEGAAVFFEVGGEVKATKVITETAPDLYANFPKLTAMGANGWTYSIPENEGAMVWDSMSRVPSWPTVEWYIDSLTEIDELKRVNRRQQRMFTAFQGPAEALNDMKSFSNALEMGGHVFLNNNLQIDTDGLVKAISTGVKYLQDDFQSDLQNTLNEAYLFLGIEHMGIEKKAHVLESEAGITNDSVARIREDLLFPRQQAAEAANKLFGTNISVEWRTYEKDSMEGNPSGATPTSEEKN